MTLEACYQTRREGKKMDDNFGGDGNGFGLFFFHLFCHIVKRSEIHRAIWTSDMHEEKSNLGAFSSQYNPPNKRIISETELKTFIQFKLRN